LELETRKLQTEMTRVQDDSKKLASDYTELKKRMAEVAETARRYLERPNAPKRNIGARFKSSRPVHHGIKEDIRCQLSDLQR
jgi:predicted  nucleic acid-binding Zn-ribbon protein